jgi:hypothetical protein
MLLSQHAVFFEAPRLGLIVALATSEGFIMGCLAAYGDRNPADDAADVIAVLYRDNCYKVEALTPDGEAFLSLF